MTPIPNRLVGCIVVLLCFVVSVPCLAAQRDPLAVDLPELEVMPGAQWYWAGRQMAVDNIPMSVKLFSYPGKADDVLKYYLGRWKVRGHGKLSQKSIGDLTILGYELDGFQYSVQFSQQGAVVDGKIVVSPTPLNYHSHRKTSFPLPPRTKVSSKVESLEMGKRSESLTLDSSLGVEQIVHFYTDQLLADGWQQYSSSGDGRTGAVLGFQRQGELLQLSIKGLQGRNSSFSQVLINWVK